MYPSTVWRVQVRNGAWHTRIRTHAVSENAVVAGIHVWRLSGVSRTANNGETAPRGGYFEIPFRPSPDKCAAAAIRRTAENNGYVTRTLVSPISARHSNGISSKTETRVHNTALSMYVNNTRVRIKHLYAHVSLSVYNNAAIMANTNNNTI